MLRILKRSYKRAFTLYGLVNLPMALVAKPDLPNPQLWLLRLAIFPTCLLWAIVVDFISHSGYVELPPPWQDKAYEEGGINELGSITKYP